MNAMYKCSTLYCYKSLIIDIISYFYDFYFIKYKIMNSEERQQVYLLEHKTEF